MSISQETLNNNFLVTNRPIFLPKMSKEVLGTGQRLSMTVGIFNNCFFLQNSGPLKVTLVQ